MSYYALIEQGINKDGLVVQVESSDIDSYPGTGSLWTDLTGGEDGALVNAPSFTTDPTIGGILTFASASSQYANFGNTLAYTSGDFTFEVWIKFTSLPASNTTVLSKAFEPNQTSYWLQISSAKAINFLTTNSVGGATVVSGTATNEVVINTWYLLTVVKSGTSVKIFKNAVNRTTVSGTHLTLATSLNPRDFHLGRHVYVGQNINASIEYFTNYNRALSDVEVLENFDIRKSKFGY